MNLGGGGGSELGLRHCTPAWRDSEIPSQKKKKKKKESMSQGKNLDEDCGERETRVMKVAKSEQEIIGRKEPKTWKQRAKG